MIVRFVCIICFWIASHAVQAADFRVTFINPGDETGFWGEVTRTMSAAADDLNVDLEILNANRQPYAMEELLSHRLEQGDLPDYFILVNEHQSAARLMQLMEGRPSKVLFLLNKLTPNQKTILERRNIDLRSIVATIVPDDENAGYEMAEALFEDARRNGADQGKIRLLALTGDTSTPAGVLRELGMLRAVASNDDVELVHAIPAGWEETVAYERTRNVLMRTHVDVIWSASDDMAFGARRASDELGLKAGGDIFFAGLGWSRRGMDSVQNMEMSLTHGGEFFAGAWAMVMLRDHYFKSVKGEVFVDVLFKMSPITAENVAIYLNHLGDGNWDKIDFRRFCKSATGRSHYDFSAEAILEAAGS